MSEGPEAASDVPAPQLERDFSFGTALYYLKRGRRVARAGWNGRGMWLTLVLHRLEPFLIDKAVSYRVYDGPEGFGTCLPWIGMKTAGDKFTPWQASQTDMLSEDWCLVE